MLLTILLSTLSCSYWFSHGVYYVHIQCQVLTVQYLIYHLRLIFTVYCGYWVYVYLRFCTRYLFLLWHRLSSFVAIIIIRHYYSFPYFLYSLTDYARKNFFFFFFFEEWLTVKIHGLTGLFRAVAFLGPTWDLQGPGPPTLSSRKKVTYSS